MTNSRQLAGLIGPAVVAIGVTEWLNFDIFANQSASVVYLNGTILFVAGLALVRAHNRWSWDWRVFVTITAWIVLLGGLYRMAAPQAPQASANMATDAMFAAMILIGSFLTYKGCGPQIGRRRVPPEKPVSG